MILFNNFTPDHYEVALRPPISLLTDRDFKPAYYFELLIDNIIFLKMLEKSNHVILNYLNYFELSHIFR